LDPFLGTGTTAAVAKALGRNAIGVDLSRDYLRLAEWRVNDPGIHRKVLERSGVKVPKPPVIDGQLDLLDGAA
jgi:site-specific DNA-methyltransferase (adenine-specific)